MRSLDKFEEMVVENVPKLLHLTRATKSVNSLYNLQIRCHVTPVSRDGEGVKRIFNDRVYVHVRAEPTKGQANAAVCKVLAEVLGVPKSDIKITGKQRIKVGVVSGIKLENDSEEEFSKRVIEKLEEACLKGKSH